MAKANRNYITPPLSELFQDPVLRSAFRRAERDLGDDYAALVEEDHPRTLDRGAAELLTGSGARRVPILVSDRGLSRCGEGGFGRPLFIRAPEPNAAFRSYSTRIGFPNFGPRSDQRGFFFRCVPHLRKP